MIRTAILSALAVVALAAADAAADAKAKPYPIDTCLVMGEKVDKDSASVVVEGQEFKVCCKGCIKKIQADPKGYLAKLAEAEKAAPKK